MVASSRLAGIRSTGRRSPAWTRARSWSRSWTYRGTWDSGWRCTGSIVSHPEPILHEIGLEQEPNCLFRRIRNKKLRQIGWLTEFGITLTSSAGELGGWDWRCRFGMGGVEFKSPDLG